MATKQSRGSGDVTIYDPGLSQGRLDQQDSLPPGIVLSGTNTGDVTLTAVGAAPNASGASLAGQVLTLQPADGTRPGVVTTGVQTFGGAKTFTGGIIGNVSGIGTTSLSLSSGVLDGPAAIGIILNNTIPLANLGAILLDIRNNGVSKAGIFSDGFAFFSAVTVTTSGITGGYQMVSGAQYTDDGVNGTPRISGVVPDGATAVGCIIDTGTNYANAAAKLLSVRNASVEKFAIFPDGHLGIGAAAGRAFISTDGAGNSWSPGAFVGGVVGGSFTTTGGFFSSANAGVTAVVGGIAPSGASAVAVIVRNFITIATGNIAARLLSIHNNNTTTPVMAVGIHGNGIYEASGGASFLDDSATAGNRDAGNVSRGLNAFTAGTATVTITAALCTATSRVLAVLQTNDATAILKNVVPGAGSFVVNLTANCTGITKFGWFIEN